MRMARLAAVASACLMAAASLLAPGQQAFGASTPQGGFPVRVPDGWGGSVVISHRPDRIISLSPTATEMLFAIGAGHQVIAVDNDSDYPPQAPRTSLSGYTPNVEAIAGYRPDLVVIAYNPHGLAAALARLHIPTLMLGAPANLSGTYSQIEELGIATGDRVGAARLVASMRAQVARLVAEAPRPPKPLTYYYELDYNPYYTVTPDTFIGSLLKMVGLVDIDTSTKAGAYPEISAEAILAADPDLIFLADTGPDGAQTPATVSARPGWQVITAVRHHWIFALNPDIASRWGPRTVDLLRAVVEDMREVVAEEHHAA